jgi:hypothetical protein
MIRRRQRVIGEPVRQPPPPPSDITPRSPHWCVHYRAMTEYTMCQAHVEYALFKDAGTPVLLWPCFLDGFGESKPGAVSCAKLRKPKPEEIVAYQRKNQNRYEKLAIVMAAILPWRRVSKLRRMAGSEVRNCPVCGGKNTLSMTISLRGHVMGRCSTPECVSWME